jgi:hypothetical protein
MSGSYPGDFDGFHLFLRFADGCRHYLADRGVISREDSEAISRYLRNRHEIPSEDLVKKIYYVAYPDLVRIMEDEGRKSPFERDAVRRFCLIEHNTRKFKEGNLVCIAYPGRVLEAKKRARPAGRDKNVLEQVYEARVSLEPITGILPIEPDIQLKKGDYVMVHRLNVIEKLPKAWYDRATQHLQELGLDKTFKFPRAAIKYLERLDGKGDVM